MTMVTGISTWGAKQYILIKEKLHEYFRPNVKRTAIY
jgi:hypothetical protein